MTVEQIVEIPADRRLVLNVPPEIPAGRVILTFSPAAPLAEGPGEDTGLNIITVEQLKALVGDGLEKLSRTGYRQPLDLREAQMEIAWASGKPHDGKSFSKYAGCLKNSPLFAGDSVAIQREMRNEW
jgi:hypothetical protein